MDYSSSSENSTTRFRFKDLVSGDELYTFMLKVQFVMFAPLNDGGNTGFHSISSCC